MTVPSAADVAEAPVDPTWEPIRVGEIRVQRAAMGVLAGWATVNLTAGGVGWAVAEDPRTRAFHQGNALWNTVNLGLATASWLGSRRPPVDLATTTRRSRALDRALLVNAALDVGYLATGLGMAAAGGRMDDPRLRGWGEALMVQGGFLLGFDLTFRAAHRPWTRRLEREAPSVEDRGR